LNIPLIAGQIFLSGGVLVPDILDSRPVMTEFYDVKPNSPTGIVDGFAKLAAIEAFLFFNSLPYTPGVLYTPTPFLPIPLAGPALGAVIGPLPVSICGAPNVTLGTLRAAPGLLLYKLCIEADLECYAKVIGLELLIAAIIVAILTFGGGFGPVPVPVPVPVPL
jgi:hypothetical protein